MASVIKRTHKDGSPSYFVKYRDGGGRIRWERCGSKAKDAQARKAEVELELARSGGTWRPPARILFAAYADEWLARSTARERVRENYERELKRAKEHFGDVALAGLSRSSVKAFLAERAA